MKLLVAVFLFIAFATLFYLPAGADDQDGVQILVTPKVIAISVDETQLDYGSPEVGTIGNLPSPLGFNVTNDSTVAVDLQILGADTTSSSGSWTLGTSPGLDTYVQYYAADWPTPLYPDNFATLKKLAEDFKPDLAIGSFVNIKLALDMPTTTAKLDQHSAPVTVIATEAIP